MMNTTTYTIESVHGVKQTFVLGILDRSVGQQPAKDKPAQVPVKPEVSTSQVAPQSAR